MLRGQKDKEKPSKEPRGEEARGDTETKEGKCGSNDLESKVRKCMEGEGITSPMKER